MYSNGRLLFPVYDFLTPSPAAAVAAVAVADNGAGVPNAPSRGRNEPGCEYVEDAVAEAGDAALALAPFVSAAPNRDAPGCAW